MTCTFLSMGSKQLYNSLRMYYQIMLIVIDIQKAVECAVNDNSRPYMTNSHIPASFMTSFVYIRCDWHTADESYGYEVIKIGLLA